MSEKEMLAKSESLRSWYAELAIIAYTALVMIATVYIVGCI